MTPKLHMVNKSGKTGIITCDFWDRDDKDRDFVELAKLLEDLGTKFDAIANILVFVGKLNGTEVIGQLCYGSGTPILYTKPVIRGPVIDFGPVTTTVWNEVKNLQF